MFIKYEPSIDDCFSSEKIEFENLFKVFIFFKKDRATIFNLPSVL
jgi:hypothetical protein